MVFEGNTAVILISLLGAVSIGGLAFLVLDPLLSDRRRGQQRMKNMAEKKKAAARNRLEDIANQRKRNVADSLKVLEEQQKARSRATLRVRLERAGLRWSPRTFWIVSAVLGLAAGFAVLSSGVSPWVALGALAVGAFGLPRWLLSFLRKRRQIQFLNEFANSLDVIVRGVRAGLPINDCLQMIAREAREPVSGEFRLLVESQRMGVPIDQGLVRMHERTPIPEVNFFAIVLTIQKSSGGNLAEVLGNLSRVLRDRKKMKAKIRALSQEANTSAAIIGALPFLVLAGVYFTSPDYIALLWTHPLGHVMLGGSAIWMTLGVLVMRHMMDFEI
jgi:tight adherence protein B